MAEAIRLARRGVYTSHPNPRVGCVLVKNGTVIGRGWHRRTGEAHAEINALADCKHEVRGAIAYITLEPCAHQGKTPPCVDALVTAGIGEIIAAGEDPDPRVAGKGFRQLANAGIEVRTGLLQESARKLNEGFFSRIARGRPFVRLKVAASLDGRTAMASGESQWISGPEARADVQRLRAASGAVLCGVATVLADDPLLTVRDQQIDNDGRQPLRVVLDSHLRTPPDAKMLRQAGETLLFCTDDANRQALVAAGAEVDVVAASNGRVDARSALSKLGVRRINDVLVEAGPTLAGILLMAGLVDELVIYQAPNIIGSEGRGMFTTPEWSTLNQRLALQIIDSRQVGSDVRITARPDV
jgi:diaminohydroxyphosphoribosylaminopyrimidine deaminase/5-amino-6-(5-phosphoribosylamino)uracil reductase